MERFQDLYPSAMECLAKDLPSCLTYLKFPAAHAKIIRTTNLMERTFGEGRRRTKVIPRFPTEGSGLSLIFSVLIRASEKWRGVRMTPKIQRHLDALRAQAQNRGPRETGPGKAAETRPSSETDRMPSIRELEEAHLNSELVEAH